MARKHQTPVWLAITAGLEVASDCGGLESAMAVAVLGLPLRAVPPAHTSDPAVPVTWFGLQVKKLTVPVGVPPAGSPVTTAWSNTEAPNETLLTGVPLPSTGVVTVAVGSCRALRAAPR